MTNWKRLLSLVLCICMLASMMPNWAIGVHAEDDEAEQTVVQEEQAQEETEAVEEPAEEEKTEQAEELAEQEKNEEESKEEDIPEDSEEKDNDKQYPWDGMTDEEFAEWVMMEENKQKIVSILSEDTEAYEMFFERLSQMEDEIYNSIMDYLSTIYDGVDGESTAYYAVNYTYNASAAVAYAKKWGYKVRNPEYSDYSGRGGDCANFVSQCLVAGGLPQDNIWYKDSSSWRISQNLKSYLTQTLGYQGFEPTSHAQIDIGDVVFSIGGDGSRYGHTMICVGKDAADGKVHIAAHSNDHDDFKYGLVTESGWSTTGITFVVKMQGVQLPTSLPAPQNVEVSQLNMSVRVSFDSVPNATSYDVHMVQEPWGWEDIKYSQTTTGNFVQFDGVEVGNYAVFVIAKNGNVQSEQSGWKYIWMYRPSFDVSIKCNGGTAAAEQPGKLYYGDQILFYTGDFSRPGYTFKGLSLHRPDDDKWFAHGQGWYTEQEITQKGYSKALYGTGEWVAMNIDMSFLWNNGDTVISAFEFYAVWEECPHVYTYSMTKEPTKAVQGTLTGVCSKCAGTTQIALPVLNETNYSYRVVKEPTTTAAGTAEYTWKNTEYGTVSITVELTAVDEGEKGAISVASVTGMAGKTVEVAVSITENPGVASMQLTVNYNSSAMKLVAVTDSQQLGDAAHSDDLDACPYTLCWANDLATTNFTYCGEIVRLQFEILENAAVGEYPIEVTYDPDNFEIFDVDGEPVNFVISAGVVKVIDVLIGDVNSDGRVNAQDRMILTRYLAKWKGYTADTVNLIAADVNCDGRVNAQDRMILTRYLAKWKGYTALPYGA